MLHTSAIVLHATCAVAAFIVGVLLIFQPAGRRQLQLARALVVLLALMGVFLLVAILSHVTSLPTIQRIVFGGLFLLLLYIIYRAVQALSVLSGQSGGHGDEQLKVVDHVGFVLISLFDGFAIVSALDLGAPGWLVAIIAVGAVVVGILALNARKTTLRMQTA
jgi:hypothetical protein